MQVKIHISSSILTESVLEPFSKVASLVFADGLFFLGDPSAADTCFCIPKSLKYASNFYIHT